MNSVKIEENITRTLQNLTKKTNLDKVEKAVVNKGLSLIKKQTKTNLRAVLPNAFRKSPLYVDTMADAIRSSVEVHQYGVLGKAHVMGKKSTGSGTFRLRFFEGGTVERIKKNGAKSGRIEPLNFFANAVSQTSGELDSVMQTEFDKQIDKILKD